MTHSSEFPNMLINLQYTYRQIFSLIKHLRWAQTPSQSDLKFCSYIVGNYYEMSSQKKATGDQMKNIKNTMLHGQATYRFKNGHSCGGIKIIWQVFQDSSKF